MTNKEVTHQPAITFYSAVVNATINCIYPEILVVNSQDGIASIIKCGMASEGH